MAVRKREGLIGFVVRAFKDAVVEPSKRPVFRRRDVAGPAEIMLQIARAPTVTGRARRMPVSILEATPVRPKLKLSRVELANGWLFGVLFDHMIRADAAWAGPVLLADRLGHLDVRRIATMAEHELGAVLRGGEGESALHRLWPRLSRSLIGTSAILIREYEGDCERLWPDGLTIRELRRRLEELPGVGPKLVAMTICNLVECYGRNFTGWRDADIAVDRHVARVFLRAGLVTGAAGKRRYSVHEVRDDVLAAARKLHPEYPGALDFGAFEIGRSYCVARQPKCRACPLRFACPQERRAWTIV